LSAIDEVINYLQVEEKITWEPEDEEEGYYIIQVATKDKRTILEKLVKLEKNKFIWEYEYIRENTFIIEIEEEFRMNTFKILDENMTAEY